MPWRGPEYPGEFPSLGYQVAGLIEKRCVIPDGDHKGEPFTLTDEQLRFLVHFYRIDIEAESFRYRRGSLIRPQKWGKGPFSAAWICAEVDPDAPVRFDGWDSAGEPVGRPWATPWVQVTAFSLDQTANVWKALKPMIELGPLRADVPDTGETRINLPNGGLITPVTSSSGSRLGQRITAAVQDESQMWMKANGMLSVHRTQLRNLAGTGGRSLETTNMPDPNLDSAGKQTLDAAEKVRDILVDATPSPEGDFTDPEVRMRVLEVVYGDSAKDGPPRDDDPGRRYWYGWVNLRRIDADCVELIAKGDVQEAERFFGNRKVASAEAAFDLTKWDRPDLIEEGWRPEAGRPVTLGFDGSESQDSTAIRGCDWETGRVFTVGTWERPEGAETWHVDEDAVNAAFTDAMETWTVGRVLCDPRGWRPWIKEWAGRWGDKVVLEFPTNSWTRMAVAVDGWVSSLNSEAGIPHDGELVLRAHLSHCRKQLVNPNRPEAGWVVVKDGPNSKRKIDAAVAAILARHARALLVGEGWEPEPESVYEQRDALVLG